MHTKPVHISTIGNYFYTPTILHLRRLYESGNMACGAQDMAIGKKLEFAPPYPHLFKKHICEQRTKENNDPEAQHQASQGISYSIIPMHITSALNQYTLRVHLSAPEQLIPTGLNNVSQQGISSMHPKVHPPTRLNSIPQQSTLMYFTSLEFLLPQFYSIWNSLTPRGLQLPEALALEHLPICILTSTAFRTLQLRESFSILSSIASRTYLLLEGFSSRKLQLHSTCFLRFIAYRTLQLLENFSPRASAFRILQLLELFSSQKATALREFQLSESISFKESAS
ncbi:hypothetical protein FNV43_RR10456 [Rhamnella rubrinervis]|uniref:Uncharacterized protein n=1 Tax=Rhamnella rubrinervis TaxID=2594499 RepID=A0A8K0HCE4_9ROSA|nr:hypothetical protein FNV43_RR10456 [Rhamnella rubrinervis]